jgi:putative ATP-binding cassette transporter
MRDLFRLLAFLVRLSGETSFARLAVIVVTLAGLVSGVASTALIALTASILNVTGAPSSSMVWAFVGLCIVLPVSRFLSQALLVTLTQRALLSLRVRLSGRVLSAPLRQLETIGAPRLLTVLTNDIGALVDSLGLVPILCMNSAIVISCLTYLGWLSWKLLLQIVGVIILGILTYQLPLMSAFKHFQASRARLDEIVGQIRAMTEGAKDLKMNTARRRAFLGSVAESTDSFQRENRSGTLIMAAASSWGQVLFFVLLGVLVLLLPRLEPVDKKVLFGYTIILFQLLPPLEVVMTAFPALSRAAIASRKIQDFGFSLKPEGPPDRQEPVLSSDWKSLELVNVTHTYRRDDEDEPFRLGPLNVDFRPGEIVFIVGGNGSGKTTFAKLLLGLYAPESGEILLSGQPVTEENRESFRQLFSVVFSDFFIFEKLLGFEDVNLDEKARRYLESLRLERKVRVEAGKLSTVELSQGQRKRLALLTAYLEDRPIYLFDEWAADQDPVFKEIFYLELLPELRGRGKTVFVISHDDHYFHVADRILKLDSGRVEFDCPVAAVPGKIFLPASFG